MKILKRALWVVTSILIGLVVYALVGALQQQLVYNFRQEQAAHLRAISDSEATKYKALQREVELLAEDVTNFEFRVSGGPEDGYLSLDEMDLLRSRYGAGELEYYGVLRINNNKENREALKRMLDSKRGPYEAAMMSSPQASVIAIEAEIRALETLTGWNLLQLCVQEFQCWNERMQ